MSARLKWEPVSGTSALLALFCNSEYVAKVNKEQWYVAYDGSLPLPSIDLNVKYQGKTIQSVSVSEEEAIVNITFTDGTIWSIHTGVML